MLQQEDSEQIRNPRATRPWRRLGRPKWRYATIRLLKEKWRAPSERIRTASEIPVEAVLKDEVAVPIHMQISEKVLHLRKLGMAYANIAARLEVNLWMAKKAARWGKGP
jgi:hypothetical protein